MAAKIGRIFFYVLIFLLPWQTRWIFREATLEYWRMSLSAVDILFSLILLSSLFIKQKISSHFYSIFIFALAAFFSIYWASDKEIAFYAWGKLVEGIILFYLFFKLGINRLKAIIIFIFAGVLQSILAIWQFVQQNILANKWLGMAAHAPEVFGDQVVEGAFGRILRSYGSLPHPNILAGFLVVCLIFLFWLAKQAHQEYQKIFLYLSGFFLTTGLFFTFSRAGWLAFFVLTTTHCLRRLIKYLIKKPPRASVVALSFFSLSIFILLAFFNWPIVLTRIKSETRLEIKSNQERTAGYQEAWQIIKKYWPTGVGIGNYTVYTKSQPVHNLYVLVAAELGIFGLLLFLALLLLNLRGWTSSNLEGSLLEGSLLEGSLLFEGFLPFFVLTLFDHYFWSLHFGILLFWLFLALLISCGKPKREET